MALKVRNNKILIKGFFFFRLSQMAKFELCVNAFDLVDVELHPHGIAPFKKKYIKSFCMHKTFTYFFPFLYLI